MTQAVVGTVVPVAWWYTPLMAGCFVLLGALIAFVSAWLSDRRRLRREDRRQWDKELLQLHVHVISTIAALHAKVRDQPSQSAAALSTLEPAQRQANLKAIRAEWQTYSDELIQISEPVRSAVATLHLIGDETTVIAAQKLQDAVGDVAGRAQDMCIIKAGDLAKVAIAMENLTAAFQKLLRLNSIDRVEVSRRALGARVRRYPSLADVIRHPLLHARVAWDEAGARARWDRAVRLTRKLRAGHMKRSTRS